MKIIIVGNGKVGYAIASQLAGERHDIVMVDDSAAALNKAENALDVMCIEGNGASIRVLKEAGAQAADLVIAVTNLDDTNLLCCFIAKKLGAGHTIARVRSPEYRRDADMLKKEIGLDMVINPDLAAAQEIARIVSTPSAFSVEPFAGGRIDMIGFDVTTQTSVAGRTLSEYSSHTSAKVLFCVAVHDGEMVIPNGAFVPQIGDKLYMIGAKGQLQSMLHSLGHSSQHKVRAVSILGGSRTAMYLVWELKKRGIKSQIVEMSHQKCLTLSSDLPDTLVIEGDGTDNDLLREEGVFAADAFVSLTDRDEENLLMALSAQRAGVGKVLAKMTRPNYMDLVRDTRISSIISPKDIVANQITRYVRALANSEGSFVESLYKMMGGQVEALEFTAGPECRELLDKPMKDLPLKQGVLVGAIARDREIVIPDGNTCIREGDHVVVVTKTTGTDDLMDILR